MTRLKVVQHNVHTWGTRKFDLSNTYRHIDPDVILINSHGLRNDARLKIPGYRVHQQNISNELHDGVAIAVKTRIQHKVEDDFLSDTLAIEINTTDGPLTIATTYLPPRRPYIPHPDFLRLLRRQTPVLLAGDLNARHTTLGHATTNQVGRDLIDYTRHQTALHLGPNFPTFFGPTSTSSPDIVLINRTNFYNHYLSPGPLTTSDHIPIIIDISTSPILIPTPRRYQYKSTDWEAFKSDPLLDMTDEADISRGSLREIDDAIGTWTNKVLTAMNLHIPTMTYKLQPAPFPSRTTQLLRIQYTALRDRASRYGWTYDDFRRLTDIRSRLREARQTEANDHWRDALTRLADNYRDPALFWRRLKLLSGRNQPQDSYLETDNGQRVFTDSDKGRLFSNIWGRVYTDNFDDDFDENEPVLDYMTNNTHRAQPHDRADPARLTGDTLLDCRISSEELAHAIKGGRTTSPGGSGIDRTILSYLPQAATRRLLEIFNAALSAGYFPTAYKGAVMRMIPKAGKVLTRPENYRPISLLEVPGKMLERVITRRLQSHLEETNSLHPAQYGFRRRRGTTHAIAVASETIGLHLANRDRCNLTLRDVSKAFDKVWHLGLQFKLLHLGLPGLVERLLCNFLVGRTASIKIRSQVSAPFPLATGVPQGSVLSPTLYAVYTSDCPDSEAGVNIIYADDISQVTFHPGRSSRMLNLHTAREISRVNTFEAEWKIKTNRAKFHVVPVASTKPAPLIIDGQRTEFSRRGTILGLSVSTHGYTTHVTSRVTQARAALTTLFRFRSLSTRIKLRLIKALVIPILTYPPIPIHALSKTAVSRLQKVQNSAIRFALGTRWDDFRTSQSLHEEASIPALNIRLHDLATSIWQRMAEEDWDQFRTIQDLHDGAPDRHHAWFPRSLLALERDPNPAPRYK